MERGLIWLPLLGLFFWLAWQGRNEFQKVEAYQNWAKQFEKSKYDIYAVLGQNGNELTWGKPTRTGPIDLKTFSLDRVQEIHLLVEEKPVALETPPNKGKAIALEFVMQDSQDTVRIPFTEIPIAVEWGKYLLKKKN
ncbi:hypothetical protein [Chroococcidiopsis sp. CCNUC1]|jgi:hypothetical protein|uniref:hypothetical protein n=1 Tax=Chroococcidiopsis sp. CCNUC1 TaxID=2653189 RepID=UPI000D0643CF|nr:hypothetical protein [Chroococcidiopsis sp. CCNUC1]PSB48784.1 hypothetical protein C7B80_04705 [Cyanosarcina cf. burmensis CCALA 770]URD48347.1 hypothetical protein M5J74_18620 [Chroococcidiopsis sp. CCNUC1]